MKKPTLNDLKKKAQEEFNKFIRARDQNPDKTWTCISCSKIVSKCNASHYAPVKAYDHMRFDEDNVNASCIYCNGMAEGNTIGYRRGLINKIGIDKVTQLEDRALNKDTNFKWTVTQIEDIITKYKNLNNERKFK